MSNKSKDELAYWLVTHRYHRMGPMRFAAALKEFGKLSNCFNYETPTQDFVKWCQHHGVHQVVPDWSGTERDIEFAQKPECVILTWQDERYPSRLKEIGGAPPILFVEGHWESLSQPQLAIVGSRHPTAQGREHAHCFAYELTQHGLGVTSGLALGIDSASHEGALAGKGLTIAVLGNGLDGIYPPQNKGLAQRIKETGVLLSEFPIGMPPKAENFPRRNRLISGLSLGVLVVESALKSGSLITASYALEQGRDVFALPGSIHNPLVKGNHALIRQGAKCVESVAHILEEFPALGALDFVQIPGVEKVAEGGILSFIEEGCTSIDTLVSRVGLTVDKIASLLLVLELEGKVVSVPGGYARVTNSV